uniref:Uncharacterized protein n=1 Tax=Arundo donax TaxID=35708 RepID=A0A0A9BHN2_ARUDO
MCLHPCFIWHSELSLASKVGRCTMAMFSVSLPSN